MENQQLRDYIKQQLERGLSKEDVKNILVSNGRSAADVDAILNLMDPISVTPPVEPVSPLAPNAVYNPAPLIVNIPPSSVKHGGSKALLVGILSALGLLLIAGSVLAYPYVFPSPEKVVRDMFTNLPAVRALEYKGEIRSELTGFSGTIPGIPEQAGPQNITFTISLDGATDFIDLNNVKNRAVVGIKADSSVSVVQVGLNIGLEIRNIGPIIYIKLGDIPPIGPFDVSFLSNQWVKIDITPYKEQFVEGFQSEIPEEYQKPTTEQIEEIGGILAEAQILDVTEKLPGEKINGVSTYHYKFIINKENINKAFIAIYASQDKAPDEQWLVDMAAGLEQMGVVDGEIWIGKRDKLPYKVIINSATVKTAEVEFGTKSTITFTFNNYNKPVQVEVPAETKTIEEVIGQLLMGGSAGSADELLEQEKDSQRLSDLMSLNSALALYLVDTSPKLSCTNGKVYSSLDGTTAVDGTGWLPVNFNKITVNGLPLEQLPIDPTNDTSAHYTYGCTPNTDKYELNAILKSNKYAVTQNLDATDGGNNPNVFEVGNDVGLDILTGDVSLQVNNTNTVSGRIIAQDNNAARHSAVATILNAIGQNIVDNRGEFVCSAGALPSVSTRMASSGGYNIVTCIIPTYVPAMVYDPTLVGAHFTSNTDYDSGYNVMLDTMTGRITVSAPGAELGETISVTR